MIETYEAVVVAAIVALPATVTPLLLAAISGRAAARAKQQDYDRQDVVAAQLIARQDLVTEQARQTARTLLASNDRIAVVARETADRLGGKLEQIHTLVNSNLTAEMNGRLIATKGQLAGLREVVELKRLAGHKPTEDALEAIIAIEKVIGELETTLAERASQTLVADTQAGGG